LFDYNLNLFIQTFFAEDAKTGANAKWGFRISFSKVDFGSLDFEFLFNFWAKNPKYNLHYSVWDIEAQDAYGEGFRIYFPWFILSSLNLDCIAYMVYLPYYSFIIFTIL
jgi:hypothetical protein